MDGEAVQLETKNSRGLAKRKDQEPTILIGVLRENPRLAGDERPDSNADASRSSGVLP